MTKQGQVGSGDNAPDHDAATPGKLSASIATASDDDLLRRIQLREERALAALYDRYGGMAFALAFRILG
ncbi:MAG: hypothetical protein C4345_07760, partial [Chloroflexota bacterium]